MLPQYQRKCIPSEMYLLRNASCNNKKIENSNENKPENINCISKTFNCHQCKEENKKSCDCAKQRLKMTAGFLQTTAAATAASAALQQQQQQQQNLQSLNEKLLG